MNLRRLVICDRDKDYCAALLDYMRRSDCGYEVVTYTDPQVFHSECPGKTVSLLLIQEEFLAEAESLSEEGCAVRADGHTMADRQFVLTEDKEKAGCPDHIYKYQSAARIVAAVGEDLEAAHRIVNDMERCAGMELIGVYSPLSHTLKTTFALTLSQILSERMPVLYINMEGYNGLTGILDIRSEYGLTDIIYDYSLHPEGLAGMLAQYTVRVNELDVLLPARSPSEVMEVEPTMWLSLIGSLADSGKFGAMVLDISDVVRGAFDLMNVCTSVYMPVRKDVMAIAKLRDFEYVLSGYPGAEGIRNKMRRLKFPYFDDVDANMSSMKNSRLGRYIRQEIAGDDGCSA